MGSFTVVIVIPWTQVLVSLVGVFPVFCVGPLVQGGLDKSLRLTVCLRGIGLGSAVFDLHLLTGLCEQPRAIAASVVGQQGADGDAVAGEE